MKNLYTALLMLLTTASVVAQAPQKISYQSVIRSASNVLITNTTVGIKVSILQGSVNGVAVYEETQSPTTNANGLMNLSIGTGTVVSGVFADVDWSTGSYFVKTEIDPVGGVNYTLIGTSELLSVPYALHAKTVDTPTYTIGLWPELGGYVFRISADGKHGLVAETQDQNYGDIYNTQDRISDPSGHSVDGAKFTDWRLPTKYELNELYLAREAIGGFDTVFYWSSTGVENSYPAKNSAWSQYFYNGLQFSGHSPLYSANIRSVRSF